MRRRHKILLTIGLVFGLMAFVAGLYHLHLKSVNDAYLAQLVAQGEPMTLAEVLPPAVPPTENSAAVFLQAAALLQNDTSLLQSNHPYAMLPTAPGKAAAGSQQPEAVGYQSTNSWKAVAAALVENQTALDLLGQIIAHPNLDFRFRYDAGVGDIGLYTNLHLVDLRRAEKYLTTALVSSLRHRDAISAVKYHRALLALILATQNQRMVVCQWVRMAMLYNTQSSLWNILQSPDATDSELALLQHDWEQVDFKRSNLNAMAMERVLGEIMLTRYRHSTDELEACLDLETKARQSFLGIPGESKSVLERIRTAGEIFLWRFWWSYPDELRSLKGFDALMGSARLVTTNGCFHTALTNQNTALDALHISDLPGVWESILFFNDPFQSLMSQGVSAVSDTTDKMMVAETTRQMAITAIALQRFKLAQGHFPAHLSELIPAYLTTTPLDPVDGQPLRYRLQADGNFLLYSVGKNGVDDGGNPAASDGDSYKNYSWLSFKALDWVWPQPVIPTNP